MLVPVLVLGIIGCAQGVTETEVDAYIQTAWSNLSGQNALGTSQSGGADEIQLIISANQMTVKNQQWVSNPFRVEYSYAGAGVHKNRVDVAALATGAVNWVFAANATIEDAQSLRNLLIALGVGDLVDSATGTYKTYGDLNTMFDGFFNPAVATFYAGIAASAIVPGNATMAAASALIDPVKAAFDLMVPANIAGDVIVGDLQMYLWENNLDLGKFKTLYVNSTKDGNPAAGAATLNLLKYTEPSGGDTYWYKYDNLRTRPALGPYANKK